MPELDRRDFLKLVGAGAGAAAAAGCSDPIEKLVPYVIQPEEITPGIAVHYASTCTECPVGCGLHVRTREGRPIKLEGNPQHPINQGKLCARGQVSLGRTYHPDRITGPMMRGSDGSLESVTWDEAEAKLVEKVRSAGSGTWVLGTGRGPTVDGVIDQFVSAVGAGGRLRYETFGNGALRQAAGAVFGNAVVPIFDLGGADFILDFGSDFLDTGLQPTENARQYADAREITKPHAGARHVSLAPRLSMTVSKSEDWIPSKPGSEGLVALALAKAVYDKDPGRVQGDRSAVERALASANASEAARAAGIEAKDFDALAAQLLAAKSPVALPPSVPAMTSRATATAAAVLLLDAVLGAVGTAVKLPASEGPAANSQADVDALVGRMNGGQVNVLLVHDADPVYSAGKDFAAAIDKVDFVVSFASIIDETSAKADLILPDHTPMESWGDAAPRDGVRSIIQPTVRPLFDTRAIGDTLLGAARKLGASVPEGDFKAQLEKAWSDTNFRKALADGGVFGETAFADAGVAGGVAEVDFEAPSFEGSGEYTLVAYPHSFLGDGRGAALPWMQEIPDPVTKASWVSWAEISNATAEKLGVTFGDVISIETADGTIEASAYPRGGVRDDVVAIAIGQGHTVGRWASMAISGEEGVARSANVISVLGKTRDESGGRAWLGAKASLGKTGKFRRIPISQWTDNQHERGLAPTVSLHDLVADGHHGDGGHHAFDLPFDPAYDAAPDSPYRWGMAIDNDRCIGCSACIAACYIENNVPVVGEEQAIMHREMNWIRIERYNGDGKREGGESRRPWPNSEELGVSDVRVMPMLCQHCGAAPCEAVCPVIATYHTPEGINGMVYNRCVGTRYCANNCTYKVRRFNYYDYGHYNDNFPGIMGLMLNPDVTVRGQGVMEKCSFCFQRIMEARQVAKNEDRDIQDGEVVTACQQSCPTSAITFGNTRDPESMVVKKASDEQRRYWALHSLNTRPAITYLSQVDRTDDDERSHG